MPGDPGFQERLCWEQTTPSPRAAVHPARYPAMLGRPHALEIREEEVTQQDHLGNSPVLQADPPCPSFLLWTGIPELGSRAQQLPKQEGMSSEAGLSAEGHRPAGQPDHWAAGEFPTIISFQSPRIKMGLKKTKYCYRKLTHKSI